MFDSPPSHLSKSDQALATSVPVYPAASDGTLPDLKRGQYCYVVGANGLFAVGRGAGFMAVVPVTTDDEVYIPFGQMTPGVHYDGQPLDSELIRQAAVAARKVLDKEWSAVILTDPDTGEYRLHEGAYPYHDNGNVSVATQSYDPTGNEDDLVVNLHSHGRGKPYFSVVDDASDSRGIHISVVFGYCHDWKQLTLCTRLSVCGHTMALAGLPQWTNMPESS